MTDGNTMELQNALLLSQFRLIPVLGAFLRIHVAFAEIHNISSLNDDSYGFTLNSVDNDMINKGVDENPNKAEVSIERIAK